MTDDQKRDMIIHDYWEGRITQERANEMLRALDYHAATRSRVVRKREDRNWGGQGKPPGNLLDRKEE